MNCSFTRVHLQYCTLFRYVAPTFKSTTSPQANAVIISLAGQSQQKRANGMSDLATWKPDLPIKKKKRTSIFVFTKFLPSLNRRLLARTERAALCFWREGLSDNFKTVTRKLIWSLDVLSHAPVRWRCSASAPPLMNRVDIQCQLWMQMTSRRITPFEGAEGKKSISR